MCKLLGSDIHELSTLFFENTKMHRVCENKKGKNDDQSRFFS